MTGDKGETILTNLEAQRSLLHQYCINGDRYYRNRFDEGVKSNVRENRLVNVDELAVLDEHLSTHAAIDTRL
jgi:hypothetical protein